MAHSNADVVGKREDWSAPRRQRTISSVDQRPVASALHRFLAHLAHVGRALQTGSFINTIWGEAGTNLGNAQMFLIRLSMIWPLKAVAPIAYCYWIRRLVMLLQNRPPPKRVLPKTALPLLRFAISWGLQELLQLWLSMEALFFLYYQFKHWQLESRAASAPLLAPGEPMEGLKRALATVKMIQAGGKITEPRLALSFSLGRMSDCSGHPQSPTITPKSSVQDFQFFLEANGEDESGVEQVIRDWNDSRSAAIKSEPKAVLTAGDSAVIEQLADDAEVQTLKVAEVSGWFLKRHNRSEKWPLAKLRELGRGNIEEWVAWAFFGCSAGDVPHWRRQEADDLTSEIIQWMQVPLQTGKNPDAVPMRLTMDPIPSAHRPLIYYVVTQTIFSQVINVQLGGQGFAKYWSGTLLYWYRGGTADCSLPPIVFCHGIGVNVMPYRPFLTEMIERSPERTFFLISLPHISMRIKEEVPSSTEMVACLSDMLSSWGYSSAHFVGHSFGSLPMAWMARKAPSFVSMMTFIDPVCFLLVKSDVCYNFMYRKPTDPVQLLNFFLAKELYISHSLSRNFFWHQNILWPEDLPGPTLVVLNGRDSIVPAHSVRRYLTAYKQRCNATSLWVLWFPDLGHGEINFGPVGEAACARIVAEMMKMETEHLAKSQVASTTPDKS